MGEEEWGAGQGLVGPVVGNPDYADTHGAHEPPTHSPAGTWGYTHTHGRHTADHHRHTPQTHPVGSHLHLSNHNNHMFIHKYTHPCTDSHIHTKLTQQAGLIHTNTTQVHTRYHPLLVTCKHS